LTLRRITVRPWQQSHDSTVTRHRVAGRDDVHSPFSDHRFEPLESQAENDLTLALKGVGQEY
jgi:hypothetical protein